MSKLCCAAGPAKARTHRVQRVSNGFRCQEADVIVTEHLSPRLVVLLMVVHSCLTDLTAGIIVSLLPDGVASRLGCFGGSDMFPAALLCFCQAAP